MYLKPVLFWNRRPSEGVITLDLDERYYRQYQRLCAKGFQGAAYPNGKGKVLTIEHHSEPEQQLSAIRCSSNGPHLHLAAERVIERAGKVLFDPIPW